MTDGPDQARSDEIVPRRFSAGIRPTTVGPRLCINDRRPSQRNVVNSESWLDLPVQCCRTEGKAMSWLVISEVVGGRTESIHGDPDELDDLYSMLRRLKVNERFTVRPVVFDPTEAV